MILSDGAIQSLFRNRSVLTAIPWMRTMADRLASQRGRCCRDRRAGTTIFNEVRTALCAVGPEQMSVIKSALNCEQLEIQIPGTTRRF